MDDGKLAVRLWTSGTQNVIQAQRIFTHMWSYIDGDLDIKSSEDQNSTVV